MLSLFVEDNQLNMDLWLPYVMMAYCSSAHASTGFTPNNVLFGKEMVLFVVVMLDVGEKGLCQCHEYVTQLTQTLSTETKAVKKHREGGTSSSVLQQDGVSTEQSLQQDTSSAAGPVQCSSNGQERGVLDTVRYGVNKLGQQ